MQIVQINKFYPFKMLDRNNDTSEYLYPFGGIEAMMLSIKWILEAHGHKSIFFAMQHPKNLTCETSNYFVPYVDLSKSCGFVNQVKTAGRILYSFEAKRRLSKLLDKYKVDLAHLHNIYHHISPSILYELKKRNIPIVMTLHDYKMVCASYSMLSNNKPCEACQGGGYYQALKKRCVKDSLLKSALAVSEMYFHHWFLDIYDKVDVFISPSLFLKKKLEEMGFKKKIIHLPNFVDMEKLNNIDQASCEAGKNTIVYFGRLSQEKGLWTLLKASKLLNQTNVGRKLEIKIIGDGPIRDKLQERVRAEGINNVRFLGYLQGRPLYQEIKESLAVVLTSECYENNPVSVLESFALCKTVVGARIGGIPELVRDNETGLTFEPGNTEDLTSKIRYLVNNPEENARMGRNARSLIEGEFSKEKHYEKLMEIYRYAISKDNSQIK